MRVTPSSLVEVSGTNLGTLLPAPQGQGSMGHVDYICVNEGAVVAYLAATAIESPTALAIPAGETVGLLAISWPGPQPYLVFGAGGKVRVTPLVHGVG